MPDGKLRILHEDESLIAVDKPSGLFVHRSDADRSNTALLLQIVRDQVNAFLYPVHRLDRATSGIVIFAKTHNMAAALSQMFANRKIDKTYRAIVRGYCEDSGIIERPLVPARGRDKPEGHPFRETQEAVTRFRSLQRYEIPMQSDRYPTTRCSLLELKPLTGRYHQIRRHLNYVSHPVIGDSSHGDTRQNRFFAEHFDCQRLLLAAVRLQLPHPATNRPLTIDCPTDPSFTDVQERLARWQVSL